MGASGEQSARQVFEILVHEHAGMLEAFLRSLLPNNSSVDDLFQETMLVAWRRLGDFDKTRSFGAWIRGIAQVLVMEHARKGLRRPLATDPAVLGELDRRFESMMKDDDGGDGVLARHVERLRECLTKLPEAMRAAIDCVYTRDMPLAVAASALGASEEAVKKRVQRGRQYLAECLGVAGGGRAA